MNPLIRKEIRLLLPAWAAALVAALVPLLKWNDLNGAWPFAFGVGILGVALSPFGQEMSYGTFGLLLVQPEDRRRFWRIKAGLLAVVMVSVWSLSALCLWGSRDRIGLLPEMLRTSALVTLLAFCGGLWSTLLLRDMVASLFCTILAPAAILAATFLSVGHWIDPGSSRFSNIASCVLAAYLMAGFWWARRLFLGAQEVGWTGGQISLTTVRGVSLRWLAFEVNRGQNRWMALVKKELQLQEFTMVLVPLLALLYLAGLAINHFAPHWIPKEVVAGGIPAMWLAVVPLVIGCVAVAEERRLNTLEDLLCLPISRRNQFAVKLAVALVLGIVLGGIIPWLLLDLDGMRANDFSLQNAVVVAAFTTGIAFYGSSISRGVLQAVPAALCLPLLTILLFALCFKYLFAVGILAPEWYWTIVQLAWPAMILTFVWLAFKNYQRLQIGWRDWVGDLARAGAVLGCVTLASVVIFDRSWELLMPLEPCHGPARISGATRPSIGVSESGLCILLPDGRLWAGEKSLSGKSIAGGFAPGSNWVGMAAGLETAVAIRSDGTLWRIRGASGMDRIGSDSNWKKIARSCGLYFHALKQDGTLWIATYATNFIADPERVGNDSDWADVRGDIFVKRNGSEWAWEGTPIGPHGRRFPGARLVQGHWNMEGTNWLSVAGSNPTLRIRTDGSLWASGEHVPSKIFGEAVQPSPHPQEAVRVGTKSDWIALGGAGSPCVALEADGTFWTVNSDQSKRPSKYADWLAATEGYGYYGGSRGYGGTWALAKDGTLSCWNEFSLGEISTGLGRILLGPSRRPVFSCNILSEQQ
ncbi:MAG: hypothetical protein ACLQU4_16945 [Limisphaerales bacterium]